MATIENIVSPLRQDVSAEDQAECRDVRGTHQKSNGFYLYVLHTTACNDDGFDRTPVSIQTNFSALGLLFQSVAPSPRALHKRADYVFDSVCCTRSIIFGALTRTILADRCSCFHRSFLALNFSSMKIVWIVKVCIFRLFRSLLNIARTVY